MPNTTLIKDSVLWNLFNEAMGIIKAKRLSKHSARNYVISEMAAAYKIAPDSINQHEERVLYANVAKIMRLLFPKHARAATNLQREIGRGSLRFNDALEIARGNAQTRENCRQAKPGVSVTLPPRLDLIPLFGAVIAAASQSGCAPSDIASAFNDALDDFESRDH